MPSPTICEFDEAVHTADFLHKQWPFIDVEEATVFYRELGAVPGHVGAILISLWTLKKVLDHEKIATIPPPADV
jgi:hypothetical protein